MISQMVNNSGVKAWIGLVTNSAAAPSIVSPSTVAPSTDLWVWKDWTPLNFSKWESNFGILNVSDRYPCGVMRYGQWRNSFDCQTTQIHYVCEKRRKIIETVSVFLKDWWNFLIVCPDGWSPTPKHTCYNIDNAVIADWDSARRYCNQLSGGNGDLLEFDRPSMNALKLSSSFAFWLGMRRSYPGSGNFTFLQSQRVTNVLPLASDNQNTSQDCVSTKKNSGGLWYFQDCKTAIHIPICEFGMWNSTRDVLTESKINAQFTQKLKFHLICHLLIDYITVLIKLTCQISFSKYFLRVVCVL